MFEVREDVPTDITREVTSDFIAGWMSAPVWALDIETKGVDRQIEALSPVHGKIALVQINYGGSTIGVFSPEDPALLPILKVKSEDASIVIAHNAQFELAFIAEYFGIDGNNFFDTMLASEVLYAGLPFRHTYKAVALRELGLEVNKEEQKSDWSKQLTTAQITYAANDVRHLIELATVLQDKCRDAGLMDIIRLTMGALPVYADMWRQGYTCDEAQLTKCLSAYVTAYERESKAVCQALGVASINDSASLRQALGTYLKNPATGNVQADLFNPDAILYAPLESSSKEVLNTYVSEFPLVGQLLNARSLSAYLGYLERCQITLYKGTIRGSYDQCAPKGMGRATCGGEKDDEAGKVVGAADKISYVNLHNPPNPGKMAKAIVDMGLPAIRSIFTAAKGKSLLIFDFDGSHARIAAQITEDKYFRASFRDGTDCHAAVASAILRTIGVNWDGPTVSKIRKQDSADGRLATLARAIAKNCFYGWLNGAGKAKTQTTMITGGFGNATLQDASNLIDALNKLFPGIHEFHLRVKLQIKRVKFVPGTGKKYTQVRTLSGRRVHLAQLSKEGWSDGVNPNEAYISHWMMLEADAKLRAMGLIWKMAKANPQWEMRIINEAHDELNVECNPEFEQQAARFCHSAMNGSLAYWVKSIPVTEKPYSFEACKAVTWADK